MMVADLGIVGKTGFHFNDENTPNFDALLYLCGKKMPVSVLLFSMQKTSMGSLISANLT